MGDLALACPPPGMSGERVEPIRAMPLPFCLRGLRPPPRFSARVMVLAVPWRSLASCQRTYWCMRSLRIGKLKMRPSRTISPTFSAAQLCTGAVTSALDPWPSQSAQLLSHLVWPTQ